MPTTKTRSYSATIQARRKRISVKWWNIIGNVTNKVLSEAATDHIRALLTQGYTSGQLIHDDSESSAIGWWAIK